MLQAVINSKNSKKNDILDYQSIHNRDNCLEPYRLIADILKKKDIELVTPDMLTSQPLFEIQIERQNKSYSRKKFLIQLENPFHTSLPKNNNDYSVIFGWNDALYGKLNSFKKILIPTIDNREIIFNIDRDYKYVMICANKSFAKNNIKELYSSRKLVIEWFCKNNSKDFFLFGQGWKYSNQWGGLRAYLRKILKPIDTPSVFCGEVQKKSDILSNSIFSFCYENMLSENDYITEKIFDSMLSGCIPIYLGSSNILEYIPKNTFIDVRNFNNLDELYKYTNNLSSYEIDTMRESISDYIQSKDADIFRNQYFASTVTSEIMSKLDAR
jgi:alpha(1,3/1,4) fucosyltransferase